MQRANFSVLPAVAAAFAAVPASPLAAEVIVFDNSADTFVWEAEGYPQIFPATGLDITLPPTQGGRSTAHSIYLKHDAGPFPAPVVGWFESTGTSQVSIATFPLSFGWYEDVFFSMTSHVPAQTYAPTELIGPDAVWSPNEARYSGSATKLLGVAATIGVRLTLDDGVHYGWIRLLQGFLYKPVAWAYETEPNVPIAAWGTPDADGVLHVPGEYSSIRYALNNALDGQTILVADGLYQGFNNQQLDFNGKSLILRSENGPANCILKGTGFPTSGGFGVAMRAFQFHSGEGPACLIEGFTIRSASVGYLAGAASGGGGAMLLKNSSPTIRNCIFEGNTASNGGGGGEFGGAVTVLNSSARFANCLFVGNKSAGGGAVAGASSSAIFANCTFVGNQVEEWYDPSHGAVSGVVGSLVNCVVYGNEHGESLYAFTSGGPTATYSLLEGGWPGVGNIDADPLFVDPDGPDNNPATLADNDYRLASGSPCLDAASNPGVPRDVTEDLDGNQRLQDDPATTDTGLGRAPIVDMGAYEFQPPHDPADLDEDGDVDGFDLALLLGQWTGAASYAPCLPHVPPDLNGDCKINGSDLAILLGAWG